MKKIVSLVAAIFCICASAFKLADYPSAEISNGIVAAKLLLPDADQGYYRGTRFDWGGVVSSLEYKGHSYFGKWNQAPYDPKLHDAIMGPVEEFVALNFDEARPGETFIKIGVGEMVKPDANKYAFARNYEVKNAGKWKVNQEKDQVTFIHELQNAAGYSYIYTKTLKLTPGKPQLVLEHTLKNTGKKAIATSTYNHNFFMIDNEPSNENIRIVFPYEVSGEGNGFGSIINAKGKQLVYAREIVKGDQVFSAGLKGFGPSAEDYDIRIENTKSRAGVRMTCDRPLEKLVYWACPTTSCPEPYIKIAVEPGAETKWELTYDFYTF